MRPERDDGEVGHFIQADTIVPGAGNALAWNRFSYVNYNPLQYIDPGGHCLWGFILKLIIGAYNVYNATEIDPNDTPEPTSTDMTEWLVDRLNENRQSEYAQTLTESFDNFLQTDEVFEGLELWVGLVNSGSYWDYKEDIIDSGVLDQQRSEYITLGEYEINYQAVANINYGYMGGVSSLPKWVAMAGAGGAQVVDHRDNLRENVGGPLTYFDDPADNYWIGFGYYVSGKAGNDNISVDSLTNYLTDYIIAYGDPPEPISPGVYFTK